MISKGRVLSLRKIKNANFLTKNKALFIMLLIFAAGIFISCITYSAKRPLLNWEKIFTALYLKRTGAGFLKLLGLSILTYFSVLVIFFVTGTSIIGVAAVPLVLFMLGFINGGIMSYLYSGFALKGIAFNAIIILPPAVIFFVACFFAAKSAFEFSLLLSRLTLTRTGAGGHILDFKDYCAKFLLLLLVIIITSLVDAGISGMFIKFFKF